MRKQVGLWSLVFIAFSLVAASVITDIVILGVQNLSLGGPILPAWGLFVSFGAPEGDHGSSRKDTCRSGGSFLLILIDFETSF